MIAGAGHGVQTAVTLLQVTDVLPPTEDAGLDSSQAEEEEERGERPAGAYVDARHLLSSLRLTSSTSSLHWDQ